MDSLLAVDLKDKEIRDKLQRTTQLDQGFWTKFIGLIEKEQSGKYYSYWLFFT